MSVMCVLGEELCEIVILSVHLHLYSTYMCVVVWIGIEL